MPLQGERGAKRSFPAHPTTHPLNEAGGYPTVPPQPGATPGGSTAAPPHPEPAGALQRREAGEARRDWGCRGKWRRCGVPRRVEQQSRAAEARRGFGAVCRTERRHRGTSALQPNDPKVGWGQTTAAWQNVECWKWNAAMRLIQKGIAGQSLLSGWAWLSSVISVFSPQGQH